MTRVWTVIRAFKTGGKCRCADRKWWWFDPENEQYECADCHKRWKEGRK